MHRTFSGASCRTAKSSHRPSCQANRLIFFQDPKKTDLQPRPWSRPEGLRLKVKMWTTSPIRRHDLQGQGQNTTSKAKDMIFKAKDMISKDKTRTWPLRPRTWPSRPRTWSPRTRPGHNLWGQGHDLHGQGRDLQVKVKDLNHEAKARTQLAGLDMPPGQGHGLEDLSAKRSYFW